MRSTLCHDQVGEGKGTRLFQFSSLSGKDANLKTSKQANAFRIILIDGELLKFEWNLIPGLTKLQILHKIQHKLESCQDRIIFMSMLNDSEWLKKENSPESFANSEEDKNCARKVPAWTLVILRPSRRKVI